MKHTMSLRPSRSGPSPRRRRHAPEEQGVLCFGDRPAEIAPTFEAENPVGHPMTSSLEFIRAWCEEKECMIFLWGENPHICAARSHSSTDLGPDRWVDRKEAEGLLRRHGYAPTSTHRRSFFPETRERVAKVWTKVGESQEAV